MKKIIITILILFNLTGCFKNDTMEDIKITTSVYPIKYVVNYMYGEHSTLTSLYPTDSEINDFEITEVLLEQYSNNDLFIFNGLSDEKNYVKSMLKNNDNLKIIDVSSNMTFDYSIEEIWLDPNNLLTIANNIKKGFEEYIESTYLINEIKENYNNLKIDLTSIDGKYYSAAKNSSNPILIITDDAFKYLEKYGIEIISLDKDTATQKEFAKAREYLNNGDCDYIFIKYKENVSDDVKNLIEETSTEILELYTMTNLEEINLENNNYLTLMNQNLDNLKEELYNGN